MNEQEEMPVKKKTTVYDRRAWLLPEGLNAIQAYLIKGEDDWLEIGFEITEAGEGHFCVTAHDYGQREGSAGLREVVQQAESIVSVLGEFLAAAKTYLAVRPPAPPPQEEEPAP